MGWTKGDIIMSIKNFSFLGFTLACLVILSGCARNIGSGSYGDGASFGEASETYRGVVINARAVTVQPERLGDNAAGTVGGAIAGGVLGNQFGKGRGRDVTTVLGAIGGAVAGAAVEQNLKTQNGMEYSVKTDEGKILTIVQGPNPQFSVGQRVLVMVSSRRGGRSRVVADHGHGPMHN